MLIPAQLLLDIDGSSGEEFFFHQHAELRQCLSVLFQVTAAQLPQYKIHQEPKQQSALDEFSNMKSMERGTVWTRPWPSNAVKMSLPKELSLKNRFCFLTNLQCSFSFYTVCCFVDFSNICFPKILPRKNLSMPL